MQTQYGHYLLLAVEGLGVAVYNDKDFIEPQEIVDLRLGLGQPMRMTLKNFKGKQNHIAQTSAVRDMWIIPRR